MNIDLKIKDKIEQVLNSFETGRAKPNYGSLTILKDGPNGIKQITFGKQQTTEYGNLPELIRMYVARNGAYAEKFKPYATKIGKQQLVNDRTFLKMLTDSASDPVMCECQDDFFDKRYWTPMIAWADDYKFTTNLSALTLYDSFIHSGGIMRSLRRDFPESPPSMGGNEKVWIDQYVTTRRNWLANHTNPILHATVYRMDTIRSIISANDWNLNLPIKANGNIIA